LANLNQSEMALFGVLRLRALEMYLTPPTLSERRCLCTYTSEPPPTYTNKLRNPQAKRIASRVRRASGFVQIPLSQVRRRATVGSTWRFGAGALVDRVLRFFGNYSFEIPPTSGLSLTCPRTPTYHGSIP
jgi:hypothetical protein